MSEERGAYLTTDELLRLARHAEVVEKHARREEYDESELIVILSHAVSELARQLALLREERESEADAWGLEP